MKALQILVVEDEPLVREVLSVFLGEDEHHIVMAENALEGIEEFRNGKFDVVLTDRAMPGMNGEEFALEVRKLKPGQPIILLTGYGDLRSDSGEPPKCFNDVVSKPFTLNMLRQAIARAVQK